MQPLLSETFQFFKVSKLFLHGDRALTIFPSKQICSSGFTSRFIVTIMDLWDDNDNNMMIIYNLCYYKNDSVIANLASNILSHTTFS